MYTPTTSWMWFSDGRRTQSNNFPWFCLLGGLGGYEPGGRRGAPICRFSGFSGFRDLTPRRRTRRSRGYVPPPTHLTRFSGGRPPRLSNFSESGGLGGLGGYVSGGRWGAPILQISGFSTFRTPANPSGRRLLYKSSAFQQYRHRFSVFLDSRAFEI